MAIPTTRDEFKMTCLRKLGFPVIEMNLDDAQIDDRIDEAVSYWTDYHYDGTEAIFYSYQVQQSDITNKYITIPENIIGVRQVFPVGLGMGQGNIFNVRYQIALNDLYTLTSVQLTPYFMAMQNLSEIQSLLVGAQPMRFNKVTGKLYIDTDWTQIGVGNYLVVEAFSVIDPVQYPLMWKDRFLLRYATALIKQNMGMNLTKYNGMTLPGGITFNGQKWYDDATKEIAMLEDEMQKSFVLPTDFMTG